MKRTIFILIALAFLIIAAISCKKPKKESDRKRYAIIPVIEYVDSVVIIDSNYRGSADSKITITTVRHSYDTILIGPKPTGEITSKQYFLKY